MQSVDRLRSPVSSSPIHPRTTGPGGGVGVLGVNARRLEEPREDVTTYKQGFREVVTPVLERDQGVT